MTPEQLRQNAAAMLAYADGKPLQFRKIGEDEWEDMECMEPSWDLSYLEYRPKPEPKVRPWSKPEDVPPVCWLGSSSDQNIQGQYLIILVCRAGLWYFNGNIPSLLSWMELDTKTYSTDRKTWLPCVVSEPHEQP